MKNSFSDIFINRPVMTILVTLAIVIFGILSYRNLPIASIPNIQTPEITISASYPGASPETVASAVASPLEKACLGISGVKSVESYNSFGSTSVVLDLDYGTNVNDIIPDIQAAIQSAKRNMPALPSDPVYYRGNTSDMPILDYFYYSTVLNSKDLVSMITKNVVQPMQTLPGVSQVTVNSPNYSINIDVNPVKMAAYSLTFQDVEKAIVQANVASSGGKLYGNYKNLLVNPQGQISSADKFNKIVIKRIDGKDITVSDIGKTYNGKDDVGGYFFMNGKNVGEIKTISFVEVQVQKKDTANTIELATQAKQLISDSHKILSSSVKGTYLLDFSTTIKESINDVKFTLFLAFCLVLLTIFLFLGRISDTFIPGVVLPVVIIGTFAVMYLLGFEIDNLTLLALTLSVGFIVDDSIVVLENTVRHIENGESPLHASTNSMREITGSVISMTCAIGIVFLPILFMKGIVAQTFREFSITVIITLVFSCILSLTLTPMMTSRLLRPITEGKEKKQSRLLTLLIAKYGTALKFVLKHAYIAVILWILCIGGSLYFYNNVSKTFVPAGDSGIIMGQFVMPEGTSSSLLEEYGKLLYDAVIKNQAIQTCAVMRQGNSSSGRIIIFLKPISQRKSIDEEIASIQASIKNVPNLGSVYFDKMPTLWLPSGEGGGDGSGGAFELMGSDSKEVYKYADIIKDKLKKDSTFTSVKTNVNFTNPQLGVEVDREKAAAYGIPVSDIMATISAAFNKNNKISEVSEGSDKYDVFLNLNERFRKKESDLSYIYISSPSSGELVPLSSLITTKMELSPNRIVQTNQLVKAKIFFNVAEGIPLDKATKIVEKVAKDVLPLNISGKFQGSAQTFLNTMGDIPFLIGISIFLLYILLGILYENFIHPFTILTTLPTVTVGGLGTLLLFKADLTLFACVGLFLLLGIVTKNGIMMVDFALQDMKERKSSSFEAIHKDCLVRFRPILMTGMTSILGAIPLIVDFTANGSLRMSLGLLLVGGLIFAQIITLFITPGFFIYMQKLQEKIYHK